MRCIYKMSNTICKVDSILEVLSAIIKTNNKRIVTVIIVRRLNRRGNQTLTISDLIFIITPINSRRLKQFAIHTTTNKFFQRTLA